MHDHCPSYLLCHVGHRLEYYSRLECFKAGIFFSTEEVGLNFLCGRSIFSSLHGEGGVKPSVTFREKERLEAPWCHFLGGAAQWRGQELMVQEAGVLKSSKGIQVHGICLWIYSNKSISINDR